MSFLTANLTQRFDTILQVFYSFGEFHVYNCINWSVFYAKNGTNLQFLSQ